MTHFKLVCPNYSFPYNCQTNECYYTHYMSSRESNCESVSNSTNQYRETKPAKNMNRTSQRVARKNLTRENLIDNGMLEISRSTKNERVCSWISTITDKALLP